MSRILYDNPTQITKKKTIQAVQCPDIYLRNVTKDKVRIVHISDTHLNHNDYFDHIPFGDVLIHSGDFFNRFTLNSNNEIVETNLLQDFSNFFNKLPHEFKIFVAGNHESYLSKFKYDDICKLLSINNKNMIYLQENSINLFGINFYGTPYTEIKHLTGPYSDWCTGFSVDTQSLIHKWNNIPVSTDILITHQPPANIMDYSKSNDFLERKKKYQDPMDWYPKWGCKYLSERIFNYVKPSVHLFGHSHRSTGYMIKNNILFVNSAMDTLRTMHYFDVKKINSDNKGQSKL